MTSMPHTLANPAAEAERYLENAQQILRDKAIEDDGLYTHIQYVQLASGIAYSAGLIILDEYLRKNDGVQFAKPETYEEYHSRLTKYGNELPALLSSAHAHLYLVGFYHGTLSVGTIKCGLEAVTQMLNYI